MPTIIPVLPDSMPVLPAHPLVPYAERRTKSHVLRLEKIYDDVKNGEVDSGWLEKVEKMDNIFPNIDYRVYRPI